MSIGLGILGLLALQVVLANPGAAARLGGLGTAAPKALARFIDPTVPLFGSSTTTSTTSSSTTSSATTTSSSSSAAQPVTITIS